MWGPRVPPPRQTDRGRALESHRSVGALLKGLGPPQDWGKRPVVGTVEMGLGCGEFHEQPEGLGGCGEMDRVKR